MSAFSHWLKDENPPLIVAELSGNHGGDLSKAMELVHSAVESGADAIKLQTYKPETITVKGKGPRFTIQEGLWQGNSLHDLYTKGMTPWEWHEPLARKATELGVFLFSTPFDESAVNFLEHSIEPPIYKISSFELNHFPMLKKIAETKKIVLASTGVSNENEVSQAIRILQSNGCPQVVLLHCVSEYPAQYKDFHLHKMPELGSVHKVPFGLSDHSDGHVMPVAAVALGARVIEKHLCLDREEDSIDGAFSMLPSEFKKMTQAVQTTHDAMGFAIEYNPDNNGNSRHFRRSILVSRKISAGDTLTEENIRIARPAGGLCPSKWQTVLGKISRVDLEIGHPLSENDFADP